jgi:hypothetical protein
MKFLITIILLSTLLTSTFARIGLGLVIDALLRDLGLNGVVGNGTPPLATNIHSVECANTNNGTYVCCQDTYNGGSNLVLKLSALSEYPITKNSINGLFDCKFAAFRI